MGKINLDELIVGGKPLPGSGISEDDLSGGHPVDPEGLIARLEGAPPPKLSDKPARNRASKKKGK